MFLVYITMSWTKFIESIRQNYLLLEAKFTTLHGVDVERKFLSKTYWEYFAGSKDIQCISVVFSLCWWMWSYPRKRNWSCWLRTVNVKWYIFLFVFKARVDIQCSMLKTGTKTSKYNACPCELRIGGRWHKLDRIFGCDSIIRFTYIEWEMDSE
jgi:hypothetical protein